MQSIQRIKSPSLEVSMIDSDVFYKLIIQVEADSEKLSQAVRDFDDKNPFTVDGRSVPAPWLNEIIEHEYAAAILALKPTVSEEALKEFIDYSLYNGENGKIGGAVAAKDHVYHFDNRFELYCYIVDLL